MENIEVKIEVKKVISERDMKGAICTATEGGDMRTWVKVATYRLRDDLSIEDFCDGGKMQDPNNYWNWVQLVPLVEGCALVLELHEKTECWDGEERDSFDLDLAALRRGAQVMSDDYPAYFHELFEDGGDAVSGDLFIQCCVFGEAVYG